MSVLHEKHITLIVTGSIAAYKACELVRLLSKARADVHVILTSAAERFVGATTFEALSGNPVLTDASHTPLSHIHLAQDACDLILVAPASADTLAKIALGIADNLASQTVLARTVPLLVAPAMNTAMWENPATRRNVRLLKEDGVLFAGPANGSLACGTTGAGRMIEPLDIVQAAEKALTEPVLAGKKLLITAGPTYEAIDPVRGLTNRSSGRQGYALAQAAFAAGADVTLVSGPVALKAPYGVTVVSVTSARDMQDAVMSRLQGTDAFIGVAAVADWRPIQAATHKIKKDTNRTPNMMLCANPDILAGVAASPDRPACVVGFAAETENEIAQAQVKLTKKGLDMIVANNAPNTFGKGTNCATLITADAARGLPELDKIDLAREILVSVARMLKARP